MVLVRCLGRVSLANTTPTMKACNMTPVMLWMHITNTASGHASVVYLEQEKSCANERLAPKRERKTNPAVEEASDEEVLKETKI